MPQASQIRTMVAKNEPPPRWSDIPPQAQSPRELTQPKAKTRRKHPKGPKLNTPTHQKPLTLQHQAPIQIIKPPHKLVHDDIRGAKYPQPQPGAPIRIRPRMQSIPQAPHPTAATAPSSAKIYPPAEIHCAVSGFIFKKVPNQKVKS